MRDKGEKKEKQKGTDSTERVDGRWQRASPSAVRIHRVLPAASPLHLSTYQGGRWEVVVGTVAAFGVAGQESARDT